MDVNFAEKKLELCKDFERSSCAKNFGDNCDNQSSNQGLGVWSPETLHWTQTSYFKRRAQKHQTCQRSLWISTGHAALGINFHAFLGKPLSFKDVQNALCEYENYNRTALSIQIEEMGDEDNRKIEMLLSGVSMTKLESLRGEWCVLCVGDIVIRIIKTSSLITSRFIRTVVRLRKPGGKMILIMRRLIRMTSVWAQRDILHILWSSFNIFMNPIYTILQRLRKLSLFSFKFCRWSYKFCEQWFMSEVVKLKLLFSAVTRRWRMMMMIFNVPRSCSIQLVIEACRGRCRLCR